MIRVVLDTNVLVSALLFEAQPTTRELLPCSSKRLRHFTAAVADVSSQWPAKWT